MGKTSSILCQTGIFIWSVEGIDEALWDSNAYLYILNKQLMPILRIDVTILCKGSMGMDTVKLGIPMKV